MYYYYYTLSFLVLRHKVRGGGTYALLYTRSNVVKTAIDILTTTAVVDTGEM